MALLDFLIGDSSLKRQRDRAIDSARDMYDPAVFGPMLSEARTRATEGIGEAEDIARARTVQSLFSPSSFSTQTGNQGRALALQSQQQQARSQALADVESQLSQADIEARQQGQRQFAQTRSQQLQTKSQQEAAIDEAEMQYEAEKDRRVQSLIGGAIGLAGTLATTPFGAAGTSLAGRGLAKLFGDGASEVVDQSQGIQWTSEALQAFGDQARSDVPVDSIFGEQTQSNARDFLGLMSQDWQQQGSVASTDDTQRDDDTGNVGQNSFMDYINQAISESQERQTQQNTQTTSLENLSRAVQAQDGFGDQTGLGELIFKGIQSGTLDPFKQYGNLVQTILEPYMRERERLRRGLE